MKPTMIGVTEFQLTRKRFIKVNTEGFRGM